MSTSQNDKCEIDCFPQQITYQSLCSETCIINSKYTQTIYPEKSSEKKKKKQSCKILLPIECF